MTKIYLEKIDLGPNGKLDLLLWGRHPSEDDLVNYFFMYGLIADEVLMQGSVFGKIGIVNAAKERLLKAFQQNEKFEMKPVLSFVLSQSSENFSEYYQKRQELFLGKNDLNNEEYVAYLKNEANAKALNFDDELTQTHIPKRKKSPSSKFRENISSMLQRDLYKKYKIKDEVTKQIEIYLKNQSDIQTYDLYKNIQFIDPHQFELVKRLVRNKYFDANAYILEAMQTTDAEAYFYQNLTIFFKFIGLNNFLDNPKKISGEVLLSIKGLSSFQILKNEYIKCQSKNQINELFEVIYRNTPNDLERDALKKMTGSTIGAGVTALATPLIGFFAKTVTELIFDKATAEQNKKIKSALQDFQRDIKTIEKGIVF